MADYETTLLDELLHSHFLMFDFHILASARHRDTAIFDSPMNCQPGLYITLTQDIDRSDYRWTTFNVYI